MRRRGGRDSEAGVGEGLHCGDDAAGREEAASEQGEARELDQPKEVEEVEGGADEVVTGQVVD